MTYEELPGLNWSSLKHMARSPLHYLWRTQHPQPRTAAMEIGAAVHVATLEPGRFDSLYAVYEGKRDKRTKAYQEWLEHHPGTTALRPADYKMALGVAEAVRSHPVAGPLIKPGAGRFEAVIEWAAQPANAQAKGRVDLLRPDGVVDLKTATSIDARAVGQAAAKYLYHGQLAWYHDGAVEAKAIPYDAPPPIIISVEKEPPYDVAVDQLSANDLWAGRALYQRLLSQLQVCAETDYWPGAAPELRQLDLPAYADGNDDIDATEVF